MILGLSTISGFFTSGEILKKAEKIVDVDQLNPDCSKCGLYKTCHSPKMKVSGEGKKKILIISEFPQSEEDNYGIQLVGEKGDFFRESLHSIGISLNKDCWKICAVNCKPPKNKPPTHKEIKCCYPYVEKTIRELKPKLIILLGNISIASLFGEDFSNRKIERWRAYQIPDQHFKCFIIPLFSPYYLVKDFRDINLHKTFERDLKRVSHCLKRDFKEQNNYEEYVTVLRDYNDVVSLLKRIIKTKCKIAFDYETTGLKPYVKGHKISTIGIALSETEAYAFPFNYKSFWTISELNNISNLWASILRDKEIPKIIQNSKFENAWSKVIIGVNTKNVHWDTMICQHCMDNRKSSNGLKFQTFVNYGVRPYDKEIQKYLNSNGKEFNTIEKAPLKELLVYNGLDCIFTFKRYNHQKSIIPKTKNQFKAYKFFMAGIKAMGIVQHGGIQVDEQYYKNTRKDLIKKIQNIEKELISGREARKFKKQFGKPLNITSNKDLGLLFYEVLGKPPILTAKGNYKTDKSTLEGLNLPFVDKLHEMKKLEKAKGTYLSQFARESYNGEMHPFFDLHIPVSYRSCIAGNEKVLVMKNFESDPEEIPIKDIKKGDCVYCFDDNLNPQIKKVLWQGKTGNRETIQLTIKKNSGEIITLDCTPEHKIRLTNGTYKQAQELTEDDDILEA